MADQYIVTALIIAIVIMAAALIAIVMLIRGLQRDIESAGRDSA
jgi:preprotein translocase subunit SecG